MKAAPILRRASLAAALSLVAVSLASLAGEPVETTDVEVTVAGRTEKVSITDLAVGETRQMHSESGALVTATRTADSLELDIDGERTSIRMLDPASAGAPAWIDTDADGKQIVLLRRDAMQVEAATGDSHLHATDAHKVVVLDRGGEGARELDPDEIALILDDVMADAPEGKRVVIKRRIVHSTQGGADTD